MSSVARDQFLGHFLIVDAGYPITPDYITLVKKSVLNILALASCLRGVSRIPVFGCGILEPTFRVVSEWRVLMGNFHIFKENMENMENSVTVGAKIKFNEYKTYLEISMQKIANDFDFCVNEWKSKTDVKGKFHPHNYWPSRFQLTLITKKGVHPIINVLKSMKNPMGKMKKIEIVEISHSQNDEPETLTLDENFISCIFTDGNPYDLDAVFKKWISEHDPAHEQVQIILNKDSGFHIKCDLNDCAINPMLLRLSQNFSLSASFPELIPQMSLQVPDYKNSIHQLEVINKIRISDVCPSVLFGIPLRVYATRSSALKLDELRFNGEIFKALCVQLSQLEIGLLTKVKSQTSNGVKLLMQKIVPMELRLPQRPESPLLSHDECDTEERANALICQSLSQIHINDKISSDVLSIGIYENLKEHLKVESKKHSKNFDFGFQDIPKVKRAIAIKTTSPTISPGEYIPKFLKDTKLSNPDIQEMRAKRKKHPETKFVRKKDQTKEIPIHPALFSPGTISKYRKPNLHRFQLPELEENGDIEI